MSNYRDKVLNYSKMVCSEQLQRPEVLSSTLLEDLVTMKESVDNALENTNEICRDLDQIACSQLSSRLANPTLSVGKTNALLMVSLKQLGDSVLNSTEGKNFCTNIQENLSTNVTKLEDNLDNAADYLHELRMTTYQLERVYRKTKKSVDQQVSTQGEDQCSSDFDERNMITSSPLNENKL